MILYGSLTSPFVRHARISLLESGLDHGFKTVNTDEAAKASPMMRIPYLIDQDLQLNDSAVIIRHIREKAKQTYLSSIEEHEIFCSASTILDSAINLMFLEKVQGIKAEDSSQTSLLPGSGNFANRQQARIEAGLDDLEINTLEKFKPNTLANNDAALRVACLLDWGLFRKRFSLATRPRLQTFLNQAHDYAIFADTAPQA